MTKAPPLRPSRCMASRGGVRCERAVARILIGCSRLQSPFCGHHTCVVIAGGDVCSRPKLDSDPFCVEHLTCHARLGGGSRCRNRIKANAPGAFKFCAEAHNCLKDGCDGLRATDGGDDMAYCAAHRCTLPGCRSEKKADCCPYCHGHTCEFENCVAFATGKVGSNGTAKPYTRFCPRHKRCKADGCSRFTCYRADGVVSDHCDAHCCRYGDCAAPVAGPGLDFCRDHRCIERGCRGGRVSAESSLCEGHECAVMDCFEKRVRGELCWAHKCEHGDCEERRGGGGDGRFCGTHQPCPEANCGRPRATAQGGKLLDKCEDHLALKCASARCGRNAAPDRRLCDEHVCIILGCDNGRTHGGDYCPAHKCSVFGCVTGRDHMRLAAEPVIGGGPTIPKPYCSLHGCSDPLCVGPALPGRRTCPAHTMCAEAGCRRRADEVEGEADYCYEHALQQKEQRDDYDFKRATERWKDKLEGKAHGHRQHRRREEEDEEEERRRRRLRRRRRSPARARPVISPLGTDMMWDIPVRALGGLY